jgi:hypothetical protein
MTNTSRYFWVNFKDLTLFNLPQLLVSFGAFLCHFWKTGFANHLTRVKFTKKHSALNIANGFGITPFAICDRQKQNRCNVPNANNTVQLKV